MAKNIDKDMARAFVDRCGRISGNTAVVVTSPGSPHAGEPSFLLPVTEMILHGHRIASWCPKLGSFWTSLAGFNTSTTKARLNTLINAMERMNNIPAIGNYYSQRKGQVYWGIHPVTNLLSLQWTTYPPANLSHPGSPATPDDIMVNIMDSPPLEPPYQPSYNKNIEVLL